MKDNLKPTWGVKTTEQIIEDLINTLQEFRECLNSKPEPLLSEKLYDDYCKSERKKDMTFLQFCDYMISSRNLLK